MDLFSNSDTTPSSQAGGPNGRPSDISPTNESHPPHSQDSPAPIQRSCVTCRKRKVKCNKQHPCSNCVRQQIECIFPGAGRAPRRSKKQPDTELLVRLRRLENVVKTLGRQVGADGELVPEEIIGQNGITPPAAHGVAEVRAVVDKADLEDAGIGRGGEDKGHHLYREDKVAKSKDSSGDGRDPSDMVGTVTSRFGRLVVDNGRTRYVSNSFWANLAQEVEDIRGILNPSSDEEEEGSPQTTTSNHEEFVFGYRSISVEFSALHPPPEHRSIYWRTFCDNVDPLVKMLHIPSMTPKLMGARLDKVPKGLEALMFSIYYAAVSSVTDVECAERFGEAKPILLQKFRFAAEQALARANFLVTEELDVLQAFIFLLMALRRNDDARVIWTLTGLVVRIAQTMGVHRDGSHFGISPFDTEMRRRVWAQILMLDLRASEDHGCDPTILEIAYDTKPPANLNDSELWPEMEDFPHPREGMSEMTFGLVRVELSRVVRRVTYTPPAPDLCWRKHREVTLAHKEKWILDCHQKIEDTYLRHCDMMHPLHWLTAAVSRLIISKMLLMLYHPYQRLDGGASLPKDIKDHLFITSIENLEYGLLLDTELRIKNYRWLLRTYHQWHAMAFLLSELCVRTLGDTVDRAWRVLEATQQVGWRNYLPENNRHAPQEGLWRPLRKLKDKAWAERKKALAAEAEKAGIPGATEGCSNGKISPQEYLCLLQRRFEQARLRSGGDGFTVGLGDEDGVEASFVGLLRTIKRRHGETQSTEGEDANGERMDLLEDARPEATGTTSQGIMEPYYGMQQEPKSLLQRQQPLPIAPPIRQYDFPSIPLNSNIPLGFSGPTGYTGVTPEGPTNMSDIDADMNWTNWDEMFEGVGGFQYTGVQNGFGVSVGGTMHAHNASPMNWNGAGTNGWF